MSKEKIIEFLIKNKSTKFVAKDISKALDIDIQNVGNAIRKITKENVHYDTRFKKERGSKRVLVNDGIHRKSYIMKVPALFVWFEE